MQVRNRFAWIAMMLLSAGPAFGDQSYGIQLNPGERLIAINGVPVEQLGISPTGSSVISERPASNSVVQASAVQSVPSESSTGIASNIVGNLVQSGLPFSHTPGESALEKANYERRRNGVGDLIPDPELQELALQKATIAAQRRHKNHIGGSLGSARAEGVGHTQGRFLSCCLDMHASYGGAAMVQGADGWYCCLLVR